jgi:hypothetical protein
VEAYLASLPSLGPMIGKIAAPLVPGENASCDAVFAAAARAGLISVPLASGSEDLATRARLHGQRLVEVARALQGPPPGD